MDDLFMGNLDDFDDVYVPDVYGENSVYASGKVAHDSLVEQFELLIRQAKNAGISKPIKVIDNYIGQSQFDDVRTFGLKCGILFTFFSPLVLYLMKIYCAANHIDVDLPETLIMDFCKLNAGAVMVFGFGSGAQTIISYVQRGKNLLESKSPNDSNDNQIKPQ